ncbi:MULTISPECIES: type II toxin-antitoxin system antitoxin SocA domain-containing protein [unclassified Mucilaginibacter]|uniref:Panacea domain-containing protein n=1 Tax=unclassified Mucilaginibacter TaxID=2617802 RepID=UPI002AC96DB1|nr:MULTISPECIES: type II toxin-antitoxin system antitoxin SocA domain-containing protein [unclassified Mucilaginibacter]MEB0262553.1 DUF4065 domain-containing protein [Mucilaginibacter sp. 10I4]MEB0278416.1 DUF4065 domain-containing protein [Mucilaginibacter sp. 10B2]MEB0302225.1 DUF4065 domain-containing protein [Mucilaginibacter sp. 5C4]WPX24061.1 DUF4065 domain-containing protein [Mucilaginibacter sp. 5C4]
MTYSANSISDFFISQAIAAGETISPVKLQKLVYYSQAWNFTIFDRVLFDERIEAWTHGPVVKSVYERFKEFPMYSAIDTYSLELSDVNFDDESFAILSDVNSIYGEHSGKYLEDLTHNEDPWLNARIGVPSYLACNNEITLKSMKEYYSKLSGAK